MKKGLVAVVLLSLDLLFYIPISAQNLNKANKIENLKKKFDYLRRGGGVFRRQ